jgi:hypothetical protein
MRRLIAWIFGLPLVWTKDHDGEVRLRLVRSDPWNEYTACGIISKKRGSLKQDGSIENGSYMKKWKPANKKAKELFK